MKLETILYVVMIIVTIYSLSIPIKGPHINCEYSKTGFTCN